MRATLCLLSVSLPVWGAQTDALRAQELLDRAVSLAKAGKYDAAEQTLVEGAHAFRRDARFPIELGGIAWRKKQTSLVKRYLRQGLRIDPSNAYANEFLGSVYLLDGNVYAAIKYWNRIRKPTIGEVIFTPALPLRPEIAARLPAVSSGQTLTPSGLAQTEHNVERLRLFGEPQFDLAGGHSDEYQLSVRVPAAAYPLSGISGRLLPALRGLPFRQVNLDWPNIGRRATTLTSLWRWDPNKRRIAADYRAPTRSGAVSLWIDLRDENWDLNGRGSTAAADFGARSAAIGGEISFDLGRGRSWSPGVHLSRHTFQSAPVSEAPWLFANSTLWEVRNRFDLARWRMAERRLQVDSSITLRAGRVFSAQASRLLGADLAAAARWHPQQRDDLYQMGIRAYAGAIHGRLPVDALYVVAMERDNDVWLRGHLGTLNGRKGNAAMGTRYAVLQNELSRRVLRVPFLQIDAGPFLDAGNVGGQTRFGSRGWLYDTGLQASVTTFGRFRLSVIYGRDLRDGKNAVYAALSR